MRQGLGVKGKKLHRKKIPSLCRIFWGGFKMPKALEEKLKRQAKKKGFGKERTGAYVYGTLNKIEKRQNLLGKV